MVNEARSIDYIAEKEIKLMINNFPMELNGSSSYSESGSRVRKIHSTNDLFDSLFESTTKVGDCDITVDIQI